MFLKIIRKAFLCFLFLLSFLISGCAEAPDEVKSDIAEINNAKKETQEKEDTILFTSLSEAGKDAKKGYKEEMGLLHFYGDILIPECKEAYLLEMEVNSKILENLDSNMNTIMNYFGMKDNWRDCVIEESLMSDKIIGNGNRTYANEGYCFVKMKDMTVSIKQTGWFSIEKNVDKENHPYFLKIDGSIVNSYYFVNNKEDNLNKKIELNNKNITLKELDDYFEQSVNLVNTCVPELNLVLHDARIVQSKADGKQMVVFRALSNYKNIFFDSNYIFPQNSKTTNGKSFVGYEMNQQMHEIGDSCKIAVRESSYLVKREIKKYSEIIDFDSALKLLANSLPQDKTTTIESAELVYQIFYEGKEGQAWEYAYENPPTFYAAPVWKFVEKDRPGEMEATVYYVDAVSGEIYSFYKACTP